MREFWDLLMLVAGAFAFVQPDWAFRHLDRERRMKYWAIRIGLAIVGVMAILFFGIQLQHSQLHY